MSCPQVESVIDAAIRDTYRNRERPTVRALHERVRQLCHENGIRAPSWKAVNARVQQADQMSVVRDREGAKAARQRFAPVVQEYSADYAFQIVQIDHTLVDLFIVDTVHRRPLQRPWLTLAIDVASRMVAGFHLSLETPSSTSVALVVQQLVLLKGPWFEDRGIEAEWTRCFTPFCFRFEHRDGLAELVCAGCLAAVSRTPPAPSELRHAELLIATMEAVNDAEEGRGETTLARFREAIRFLWTASPNTGRPEIALFGVECPFGRASIPVTADAPMTGLYVTW
ncbi:hypothetical protein GR247_40115 [Rhizobium leguminosarum]|nr:hypothetical protein [Rhizobium leguminosarum]